MRPYILPLALAAAAACSSPPPPPPIVSADATTDTLFVPIVVAGTGFSRSDGSWVFRAVEEGRVYVADFATGTVTPHPGITTEDVPLLVGLFNAGDTALVADAGMRRLTAWVPSGTRVDAIPAPDGLNRSLPKARDAAGQWYFELAPSSGRDGSGAADSTAIVRSDPLMERFDTVAKLGPPELIAMNRDNQRRYEIPALSGRDQWGVRNEGTIWIARVHQNFVQWFAPSGGKPVATRHLPDPIIMVTDMDRQIYINQYPEDQRHLAANIPYAGVKPPFERAFADSRGRTWLFKSAPALDTVRTLQVIDSTGVRLVVKVPSYGVAVGISDTHLLMAESYPEGIRLLRFRIPDEPVAEPLAQ